MKLFLFNFLKCFSVFWIVHWGVSTNVLYASSLYREVEFVEDIIALQDLIITDFSKANQEIQKLEQKYRDNKNPEFAYVFCLSKIRFNSSYGNFPRVQFEINKARKILFHFEATKQQKLYLDLFAAMYEKLEPDVDTIIKVATHVIQESDKDNYYLLIQGHVALAKAYSQVNEMERSYHHLDLAKKYAHIFNNDAFTYFVLNATAQIYFLDDNYQKALDLFEEIKVFADKKKWKYVVQYMNLSIGEVYLFSNRLELAKNSFDAVLRNESQTELRDLYQVYGALSYYFRIIGNIDSSYHYALRQNNIDDHLENIKNQSLIDELEKEFQQESNQYLLDTEKRKNQSLRLIIVVIAILIGIFLVFSFLFIRQKNQSNRMLLKQKMEIDEKNRQITLALTLKENMIKEIHHRVKNNLQIVSSIMNLQARNITDSDALKILEEVKDRVQAIALVHNQLHLVRDSAFVQIQTYLNQLIEQLSHSYSGYETEIKIHVDVERLDIDIDKAIPIGLIMCELVSNAYKHAFVNKAKGNIFVNFNHIDRNTKFYELRVMDDGVGYHGNEELLSQSSTGVEIVYAFIQQLDASYHVRNTKHGLVISVEIPIPEDQRIS